MVVNKLGFRAGDASTLIAGADVDRDGYIDYEEFVSCCFSCQEHTYLANPSSLDYVYTREEFDELARTVDQAKTGRINYLSFLGLFSSVETASMVHTVISNGYCLGGSAASPAALVR